MQAFKKSWNTFSLAGKYLFPYDNFEQKQLKFTVMVLHIATVFFYVERGDV